jgi:hypothetical protein
MDTRATLAFFPAAILSALLALPAAASAPAGDAAVTLANDKLDLAEHAFAIARQESPTRGLRMAVMRRSSGDAQRSAFYMKDLLLARSKLLALRNAQPLLALESTFERIAPQ